MTASTPLARMGRARGRVQWYGQAEKRVKPTRIPGFRGRGKYRRAGNGLVPGGLERSQARSGAEVGTSTAPVRIDPRSPSERGVFVAQSAEVRVLSSGSSLGDRSAGCLPQESAIGSAEGRC